MNRPWLSSSVDSAGNIYNSGLQKFVFRSVR